MTRKRRIALQHIDLVDFKLERPSMMLARAADSNQPGSYVLEGASKVKHMLGFLIQAVSSRGGIMTTCPEHK